MDYTKYYPNLYEKYQKTGKTLEEFNKHMGSLLGDRAPRVTWKPQPPVQSETELHIAAEREKQAFYKHMRTLAEGFPSSISEGGHKALNEAISIVENRIKRLADEWEDDLKRSHEMWSDKKWHNDAGHPCKYCKQ